MIIIYGSSGGIGKGLLEEYHNNKMDNYICNFTHSQVNILDYNNISESYFNNPKTYGLYKLKDFHNLTVINCTGLYKSGFMHKMDHDDAQSVLDVNIMGTYNLMRFYLPLMREHKYGRIINFSSISAHKAYYGTSIYAASKAAIEAMTRTVAIENASLGITVNCIALGVAEEGMHKKYMSKEVQEKLVLDTPCHRFCSNQEIYNTVKYIIETPYLNGVTINLSGGMM
jgi:NAD(P)-dependent dehydrogenase (short-subunit alcohol dehydrogenase family)